MGAPVFAPEKIPACTEGERIIEKNIFVGGKERKVSLVSMGNPHCVIFTDNVTVSDVCGEGRAVENDKLFPRRTNVEFVQVIDARHIKMRVWERGSGETFACGTGACAAVVAAVEAGYCERGADISVKLPGGELIINYGNTVVMTGDAVEVYRGVVKL